MDSNWPAQNPLHGGKDRVYRNNWDANKINKTALVWYKQIAVYQIF